MRGPAGRIVLAAVCAAFGILLMVQIRTQGKIVSTKQAETTADQAQIVSNLYDANVALRSEVENLTAQIEKQRDEYGAARAAELASDLAKLRTMNGTVAIAGPGIELEIAADIRVEDVQDLINEFRNAGAEVLALNGDRIGGRTFVASDRGRLVVNGRLVVAPYRFAAIGAPETLDRALTRKGGLLSYLQNTYPGGRLMLTRVEALQIPAVAETPRFAFAHAAPSN
ncbi:MAG: DUF881 domain-containing protein [Chloroflexota bacterium]|nr:MAG: DUF881 domain-containing protein [Chloroflexota bacterium]